MKKIKKIVKIYKQEYWCIPLFTYVLIDKEGLYHTYSNGSWNYNGRKLVHWETVRKKRILKKWYKIMRNIYKGNGKVSLKDLEVEKNILLKDSKYANIDKNKNYELVYDRGWKYE